MEINLIISDNAQKVFESTGDGVWKKINNFSIKNKCDAKQKWEITGFVAKPDNYWISIRRGTSSKESTINMKVGRFLSYMNEYGITDLSPSQIEQAISILQSTLKGDNIQILGKEKIMEVYNAKNYKYPHLTEDSQKKGTLSTSCMRYPNCQEYIKFFGSVENVRIMAMFEKNKVVARALLWETQQGDTIMDRVYYTEEHQRESFISMAKSNKWLYYVRVNDHNYQIWDHHKEEVDEHFTIVLSEKPKPELFPFLDTFRYYDYRTHRLSNKPFVAKNNIQIVLQTTSGDAAISNNLNQETMLSAKEYERLKMKGLFHGFHILANNVDIHSLDFKDIYCGKNVVNKMDLYDISIINWGSVPRKRFIPISAKLKDGTSFMDNFLSLHSSKLRNIVNRLDILSINDYFILLKILNDAGKEELLATLDFRELSENGKELLNDIENSEIMLSMVTTTFSVKKILDFYSIGFFPNKFFRDLIISKFGDMKFINNLNHYIYLNPYSVYYGVYYLIPELAHNMDMEFIEQSKTFTLGKSFMTLIDKIRETTGKIPNKTPFKYRRGFKEKIKWFIDFIN